MDEKFSNVRVEDHLEDTVEAEFVGATLTISSDNEGVASSKEDLTGNPDEDAKNANPGQQTPSNNTEDTNVQDDPTKDFFAMRVGAFESAVEACRPVMLRNIDGGLQGAWLLTEIDHWDAEKERLVMLTDHSLLIIKYDFITLTVADYRRLLLKDFDKIIIGGFMYPGASVVPRRSGQGVRAMWNKGRPTQLTDNWNPWSKNIPWITFASHPLKSQCGGNCLNYDIDHFAKAFIQAVKLENEGKAPEAICRVEERPIVVENYLGLVSLFHNVNNLGFFKSRGRVSF